MLVIRRLKHDEKTAILDLGRQVFREEDEIPLLRKAIAQCVLDLSFVALEADEIIGFALVCKEATKYYYDFIRKIPNCYEFAFLGISPNAQGCGLGTKLMKEVLFAIFNRKKSFTCWLLVDTINIGAIRLYEKMGFRKWYSTTPDITPCPGYIMGISTRNYKRIHHTHITNSTIVNITHGIKPINYSQYQTCNVVCVS
jgi:ribosomal protein S18 acetylase RimI-like enzyme